jgi:putative addiction module component (TIGR02574 family)
MSVSLEALGIDGLSIGERLELIEQIWNSLPEQVSPEEVPAWHLPELARCLAEAKAASLGKAGREVLAGRQAES